MPPIVAAVRAPSAWRCRPAGPQARQRGPAPNAHRRSPTLGARVPSLTASALSPQQRAAVLSPAPGFRNVQSPSAVASGEHEGGPGLYDTMEEVKMDIGDVPEEEFLEVKTLRDKLTPRESPFVKNNMFGSGFVYDTDRIRLKAIQYSRTDSAGATCSDGIIDAVTGTCIPLPPFTVRAGPRKTIYYDPKEVHAAIITCGGLCPGLNDVVQNIVFMLHDYGVPEEQIFGIRNGLMGLYDNKKKPMNLTQQVVDGIQLKGGTILGTSRGGAAKIPRMVDRLDLWGINMVFVIGGNGGNAAANAIHEEAEKRGLGISVVGVPKSIDNDILLIDRCFGYETAVEESQRALLAAKVEASSAKYGLGIVKLMGRQSGFISMSASLSSGVVDVCLIPEVPFDLDKLLKHVQSILDTKGHCVMCVAEGAGQDLQETSESTDASGNPVLTDIGVFLKQYLKENLREADVKYIDPTYMIRAIPTASGDRVYCKALGQVAVHGAFAGYTDITVGMVNGHMAILPIPVIIQAPKLVNPKGSTYNRMSQALRQPDLS